MRLPALTLALGLAFLLGLPAGACAQSKRSGRIELPTLRGFRTPIRGEDGRDIALVTGAEAKSSLLEGQVDITTFRLEIYRYDPERSTDLIVESPHAAFGSSGAHSDKDLALRSASNRFTISGRGWAWARATGQLVISNDVRISVRRSLAETNRLPIEISCQRFEYDLKSGDARFLRDCVAEDAGRARVTAGALGSRLSPRETQPNSIVATNGVVIELLTAGREGRATGNAATYDATPAGDQIFVTGEPRWRFGPAEGSSDELMLLPSRDSYRARGHARLRLTSRSWPEPAAAGTEVRKGPPVEIECDAIEGGPDEVIFSGPVNARQSDRLSLDAQRLAVSLSPHPITRQPFVTRALANGSVRWHVGAGDESLDLFGDEMLYTVGEHAMIEVRGQPAWKGKGHEGSADLFVLHPEYPSFQAVQNVRVSWLPIDARSNTPPVRVRGARLSMEGREARFTGGVDAESARWQMRAEELELGLTTNRVLRGINARDGVTLDYQMAPFRAPEGAPEGAPAPKRSAATAWLAGASAEALSWRITGSELEATLDPATGDPSTLDLTGGVALRNVALEAHGDRLTYRASDGRMRLQEGAWLRTQQGMEIIGEAGTALAVDPQSARFFVEGPVRRMVFPARLLNPGASKVPPASP